MVRRLSFVIFLLTLLLGSAQTAQAQISMPGLSSGDISVDLSPEHPGANQQVTVSIQSFATDLNASTISWTVNGKSVATGRGVTQITTTTGTLGNTTTIGIHVNSPNGIVDETIPITPTSVDLTWNALTYTPPFFKGKPLFTNQSDITFIAIPHIISYGQEIPAKNLSYSWSENGTILGDKSGYGKDSLTIVSPFLPRALDISVTVSDPTSGTTAVGETTVAPENPMILFYHDDPLYGIEYQHNLQGSYTLNSPEIDLKAVPYYFSVSDTNSNDLSYSWLLNGTPLNTQNGPEQAFRRTSDNAGSSDISVSISSQSRVFQTATADILMHFNQTTATAPSL